MARVAKWPIETLKNREYSSWLVYPYSLAKTNFLLNLGPRFAIISGNSEGDFSVGEYSGVIKVNKRLDYERRNSYQLTVQAQDQATGGAVNSKYDTAAVTITVSDVNDCAPEMADSPYR